MACGANSDSSGTIDRGELDQALQSFGYPLPRDLVRKLEKRFGSFPSSPIKPVQFHSSH